MHFFSSDPVVKLVESELEIEKFFAEHELRLDNVHIAQKSFTHVARKLNAILHSQNEDSMVCMCQEI